MCHLCCALPPFVCILQLKAEMARIRERATLQHTNSSEYVRKAMRLSQQQGGDNAALKESVREARRKGTELLKRMDGREVSAEDGILDGEESESEVELNPYSAAGAESDEDSMSDGHEQEFVNMDILLRDDEGTRNNAKMTHVEYLRDKLSQLEAAIGTTEGGEDEDAAPAAAKNKKKSVASGIMALKFMQKAQDRKKLEAQALIKQIRHELAVEEERERRLEAGENEHEIDMVELENQILAQQADQGVDVSQLKRGRRVITPASTAAAVKKSKAEHKQAQANGSGKHQAEEDDSEAPSRLQFIGKTFTVKQNTAVKTKLDGNISVEQNNGPFDVEQFSDDEDNTHKASKAMNAPVDMKSVEKAAKQSAQNGTHGNKKSAAVTNHQADVKVPVNGTARNGTAQDLDESSEESEVEMEEEESEADEDKVNPWEQTVNYNPRKQARTDMKGKVTEPSENKSNGTDKASKKQVKLDSNAPLLISTSAISGSTAEHTFDLLGANKAQAELIAAAFANAEDEEQNFEQLKGEVMDVELPKVESTTVPGWVSVCVLIVSDAWLAVCSLQRTGAHPVICHFTCDRAACCCRCAGFLGWLRCGEIETYKVA